MLRPLPKQKTDALPVVRPADAFGDGGADIDGHELRARVLVLCLWNRVRDLPEQGMT